MWGYKTTVISTRNSVDHFWEFVYKYRLPDPWKAGVPVKLNHINNVVSRSRKESPS